MRKNFVDQKNLRHAISARANVSHALPYVSSIGRIAQQNREIGDE
jgi:hypothetical protein